MFSNLRVNSQLYILYKDTITIEVGNVVSVSAPIPKFPVTNFMNPQEYIVDIVVSINDSNVTFSKLPANLDIADQGAAGNIIIATSKEAINAEIQGLKQKSQSIINSIEYHQQVIEKCDALLQELNPEFAEQKQQKEEINTLKTQMSEMMSSIKELMTQLKSKE